MGRYSRFKANWRVDALGGQSQYGTFFNQVEDALESQDTRLGTTESVLCSTAKTPVPVTNYRTRLMYFSQSNGTDLGGTFRLAHTMVAAATSLRVAYTNYYLAGFGELLPTNDITVKAALETTYGKIPLSFTGATSVVIKPGGLVWSDPVGLQMFRGDTLYSRTYVTVASTGMKWPIGVTTVASLGEGNNRSATPTDLTLTGTVPTNNERAYGPVAITGISGKRGMSVIGIVGDSIATGYGEYLPDTDRGFIARALGNDYCCVNIASAGLNVWNHSVQLPNTSFRSLPLLDACTDIICELGINDATSGNAFTDTQVHFLQCWRALAFRNARVYQTTLMPQTNSTDSWATTANQTVVTPSTRTQINAWIRDGAPFQASAAGTAPGVAPGTTGTGIIRTGQEGHPLTAYLEIGDQVEYGSRTGLWKPGSITDDGLHPNPSGYILAAAGIPLNLFVNTTQSPSL